MLYLKPNSSYALTLSIKSFLRAVLNVVVNAGNKENKTDPFGIALFKVIGPNPDSKLPTPPFAPSPSTAPIFAHILSSALSVPTVTSVLFKNSRVSGDVNFTSAPTLAYFKLDVAKVPVTSGPVPWKYPVLVFVLVVVEFHVALKELKSFVLYFK